MEQGIEAIAQLLTDPSMLGVIFAAVCSGLFFGIVPGLGGKVGIAVCIGFLGVLEPASAVVFLIAMHAVVHTGGSIPSILLGVPGTGPDAATVVDGYPMARQGRAAEALGAALCASAVGGVIGALFLFSVLPLVESLLLLFGPAEFFLLTMLGMVLIASASGNNLMKGLLVGLIGLQLSMVGLNPHTGEPRLVFGQLFLWSGVDIVTALLGVFALPEIFAMAAKQPSAAAAGSYRMREVLQGMAEVFRWRWLALRTSIIGVVVGLIPGLGGDAASWICYGHAVQSSKEPQRFGNGAIEGVIAPETANNSKEGGALVPTLFFGVPGSSGMAILIGALVTLGVQPGPQLVQQDPGLIWQLVATLAIANILAVVLLLLVAPKLARVARVQPGLLIPIIFTFIMLGVFIGSYHWQNLLLLLVFGALGVALKHFKWPRPPIALGLVLGHLAEMSFLQAHAIWGLKFLLRPIPLVLLTLLFLSLGIGIRRSYKATQGSDEA